MNYFPLLKQKKQKRELTKELLHLFFFTIFFIDNKKYFLAQEGKKSFFVR